MAPPATCGLRRVGSGGHRPTRVPLPAPDRKRDDPTVERGPVRADGGEWRRGGRRGGPVRWPARVWLWVFAGAVGSRARALAARAWRTIRWQRPRRARCRACRRSTVLLADWSLPRRRDTVEVIGAALFSHARGEGHRRIAKRLVVPEGTVRGRLRRARGIAGQLRVLATVLAHDFDS